MQSDGIRKSGLWFRGVDPDEGGVIHRFAKFLSESADARHGRSRSAFDHRDLA